MTIAALIIQALIDIAKTRIQKVLETSGLSEIPIEAALERHITQVEKWSRYVQQPDMPDPVETDSGTVALGIGAIPRRFRALDGRSDIFDEKSLLQSESSFILLGAPGAGKTTTIKRLLRHFFVGPGDTLEFPWRLPILLIMREISPLEPIDVAIARKLGLPVTETYPFGPATESDRTRRQTALIQYKIGTRPVNEFVADLLNQAQALVFLDGIDELLSTDDATTWRSIANLHGSLIDAKLIATCRTGDFILRLEGVRVSEIEPLGSEQIAQIVHAWLPDPGTFLQALYNLPYRDIASRPLFLCYLLAIYRNQRRLPDSPRRVYKRIIQLAIEDWDKHRNLDRSSRYARFHTDEKLEFLATLSYQLTYQIHSTRFSHSDLVRAYASVCGAFQLPPHEAVDVAHELETHTGLIVDSGSDQFEFSHLSLQEFLCADYLVRNPHSEKLANYLEAYPAPVALATAMSSDPTSWLSVLILDTRDLHTNVKSLFSRLVDERPLFSQSVTLGLAILRLIFAAILERDVDASFLSLPNVLESVAMALQSYRVVGRAEGRILLAISKQPDSPYYSRAPQAGAVPADLYEKIIATDVRGGT